MCRRQVGWKSERSTAGREEGRVKTPGGKAGEEEEVGLIT